MPKYFITIAGNIGVGKSTLTGLLSQKLGWRSVLEAEADNPYLSDFYKDMNRWSFQSQTFFLSRRLRQHYQLLQSPDPVIQDRSVYEDAEIFARNLYQRGFMAKRDWYTYCELYEILSQLLKPPHFVVYLRASVSTLVRRISQRGRAYERTISPDYLAQLNDLYDEWAAGFRLCPVLTVETDNLDYVHHDEHLEQITLRVQDRLHGRDHLELE